jgi:tetratricopeptide (TPR) repeat protein
MHYLLDWMNWYWDGLLGWLLKLVEGWLGLSHQEGGAAVAWKAGFTMVCLLPLYEVYLRFTNLLHSRHLRRTMKGHEVHDPLANKDLRFTEELDALKHPKATLEQLRKEKRYGRMGEILSVMNEPAEAARWFAKNKQYDRAAQELAKSGHTWRAARLLWRCGDYATAARFYMEIGKARWAAQGFERAGMVGEAALAWAKADKTDKALAVYADYFRDTADSPQMQEQTANLCYQLLHDPELAQKGDPEMRAGLLVAVGERFLFAGRNALAAQLMAEAGRNDLAAQITAQMYSNAQARRQS